jgi:hypothetical protein
MDDYEQLHERAARLLALARSVQSDGHALLASRLALLAADSYERAIKAKDLSEQKTSLNARSEPAVEYRPWASVGGRWQASEKQGVRRKRKRRASSDRWYWLT